MHIHPTTFPIRVKMPNGSTISSTHEAQLDLPHITPAAQHAHVFPKLHAPLLSIGQLCDNDCTATFTKQTAIITKDNQTILRGTRDATGLWTTTLTTPHVANALEASKRDIVQYLHAAAFSPATTTWRHAIQQGFFTTWPSLNTQLVDKHLPKSIASAQGHLDQQRKNVQSTKAPTHTRRSHSIYAAIATPHETTGQTHGDLTGRFPVQSRRGNKYILIIYDYDSNSIQAQPIKNRQSTTILEAYQSIVSLLQRRGLAPKLHRLDNEASQQLKDFLQDEEIEYQLVPPHIHRRNAAERAIRTFKNHFIAGLCSTDGNFPLNLWDYLLPQAEITLNLLRPSRINPKLSAYAQLHGAFDFNKTPLAPPGTRVLVHVKPNKRTTWAPHGETGWYIGPAMEHYRCHQVFIPKTNATRIADTVEFFPQNVPLPSLSSHDTLITAALELTEALKNTKPHATIQQLQSETLQALHDLTGIFNKALPRVPSAPEPIAHRTRSHRQAHAVTEDATGRQMEYRELIRNPVTREAWTHSSANEFGRLAQGLKRGIQGTDTIRFIRKAQVPPDRKPTYARFVCDIRPQKAEVNRTRLTVGGNLINYPGDTSTKTADLITAKMLLNSTISTPGARCVCVDVKNFYLNTPMDRYEYVRIPIALVPQEVINEYNLTALTDSQGNIYLEVRKGMYGLPQAGMLANKLLAKRLAKHGYHQVRHTPGLWTHTTRPISFALVVDDFAVKYVGKEHAQHLLGALKQHYEVSIDWGATLYCGITIKWDYDNGTVDLSMPGYVAAALHKFQHTLPTRREDAPHSYNVPHYGVKVQLTEPIDESPLLDRQGRIRIQQIVGTFLYYARAVDPTMLMTLSTLAGEQATSTQQTAQRVTRFLNYCATHPEATIRYHRSDMILRVHSDASYLSEPKARSRAGGHFYLGRRAPSADLANGPLHNISTALTNVMASAAEAEIGALFVNAKQATVMRTTLEEMGHPQPATPIQTDNSTAASLANNTLKQQRSRAIDMRFYWIQDRVQQDQFIIYWAPGALNKADYFTKHHAPIHHRRMRPTYLHEANHLLQLDLQGCVDPCGGHNRPPPGGSEPAQPVTKDRSTQASRHPYVTGQQEPPGRRTAKHAWPPGMKCTS